MIKARTAVACGWDHMHGSSNIIASHQTLFPLRFPCQEHRGLLRRAKSAGTGRRNLSVFAEAIFQGEVDHRDKKVTQSKESVLQHNVFVFDKTKALLCSVYM